MLIAHKFVDSLRGGRNVSPVEVDAEIVRKLVDGIIDAEKFEFRDVPLEPQGSGALLVPDSHTRRA